MHQAEVRTIIKVTRTSGQSSVFFSEALEHSHYSGLVQNYGSHSVQMRSHVGLLTRNIVIKGDGQGEENSYHVWNVQSPSNSAAAECGNGLCEVGETSLSCIPDCIGPAWEYGVSILVGSYNEDYTLCDQYLQCQAGYRRKFSGRLELDNVEMRYFGQNNLRAGIEVLGLGEAGVNVSITKTSMNRGYFRAIDIQNTNGASIIGNLIFRSHLPMLRIQSGIGNIITKNLGTVAIFWNTHRGAIQVCLPCKPPPSLFV